MELTIEEALKRGVNAHQAGQVQEAESYYKAILNAQPKHPDANHNMGILAVGVGKLEPAVSFFKTAIEVNSTVEQFWISYINTLLNLNQIDEAKVAFNESRGHNFKGDAFGQFEERINQQQVGVSASENQDPPQHLLQPVIDFYNQGELRQALAQVDQLLEQYHNSVILYNLQGAGHAGLRNVDGAIDSFRQAINIKPNFADSHHNLGSALKEKCDLDEAISSFRQAVKIKPDHADAYDNIGICLAEKGELDGAIASYRQAIKIKPDYAEAHNNMGCALHEKGELDEAISSFRQAFKIKAEFADAYLNMGASLGEKGEFDEAINTYRQAIKIKPDYADAYKNIGICLAEKGELDGAIASYRQAIKIKPGDPVSYYGLATALRFKGEMKSSRQAYEKGFDVGEIRPLKISERKAIALFCFGRSGSIFFHSLIDGHPQVSTIPGVYFSKWFSDNIWKQFEPDFTRVNWRDNLSSNFITKFEMLFDPESDCQEINWGFSHLGKHLGFTNMGDDGLSTLSFNPDIFRNEFINLLKPLQIIDDITCIELIHAAFDMSYRKMEMQKSNDDSVLFYHTHMIPLDGMVRFLRAYPNNRMLYIIRNPVQSLESTMLSQLPPEFVTLDGWRATIKHFNAMLLNLLSPFNGANTVGIRLEDIKLYPKSVIPKIADFIGISHHSSLYESEFCGLKYWSTKSNEPNLEVLSGFDQASINRSLGNFFGERDIEIFEVLFWPLSEAYGYSNLSKQDFHYKLEEIRPWLDEPLDFEVGLYERYDNAEKPIDDLAPYKLLHTSMINVWNLLKKYGTYPGIPSPLDIAHKFD